VAGLTWEGERRRPPKPRGLPWADELARWDEHVHPRDQAGKFAHSPGGATAVAIAPAGTATVVASGERFSAAFEDAFAGSPYSSFVNHYSAADIAAGKMTPLLAAGGKAGVLIHDHGDGRVEATALFNVSGQQGLGVGLLRKAIAEHGVNYVECFGPALPKLYGSLGFADTEKFPFDPAEEPPGWDHSRFDEPSYHLMSLAPKRASRAGLVAGLDLEKIRAAAQAADPAWWAQHGQQAWAAALAVFGVTSPVGPAGPTAVRGISWDGARHPRIPGGPHGGEFARRPGSGVPGGKVTGAGAPRELPLPGFSPSRFGVTDSLSAHTRPDGTLDPARAALHQKIIAETLAGHQPQAHPVATFMGGGPAAGKSHMPGLAEGDTVHIDPDKVKLRLPEYAQKGAEGAAYTHEESSLVAKQIEAQATARRYNMTLDGVGDSTFGNMSARVQRARDAGYHVKGRYITITTAEALARNKTRKAEVGRWVPPSVLKVKYARVAQVFPKLIDGGSFDEAELWNNNVPKGSPPKLIGSKPAGGRWRVRDGAAWRRFLADAPLAAAGSGST
jgi:predicted ABC-type ATPase